MIDQIKKDIHDLYRTRISGFADEANGGGEIEVRISIVMVVLAAVLTGCQSNGIQAIKDETNQTVGQKINRGVSNKDSVRVAYGDPSSTSFTDSGNEIWTYEYNKTTPKAVNFIPVVGDFVGGMDVNKKHVVFFFDRDGIVQNFTVSSANVEELNNR